MQVIKVIFVRPHYGLWILFGVVMSCLCVYMNFVGVLGFGLGAVGKVIAPYKLLLSPEEQKIVDRIESGDPPVSLVTIVKTCDVQEGCEVTSFYRPTWKVSTGQKYLEIALSNPTPSKTDAQFTVTGITYSPDVEMVCSVDFLVEQFAPNGQQTTDCRTMDPAISLPDRICYDIEYPELYTNTSPAKSPKAAICGEVTR